MWLKMIEDNYVNDMNDVVFSVSIWLNDIKWKNNE